MKKILLYHLFLIFLFSISCRNNNNKDLQFINKYGKDNFNVFKGKSLFVRGFDNRNPIIFVYDNTKINRPCDMYYSFVINKNNYTVLESNYSLIPDSCGVNKTLCSEIAIKFCRYNINYLSVDLSNTIIVRSSNDERGNRLVKFNNPSNIPKEFYGLKPVKDGWHQYNPFQEE